MDLTDQQEYLQTLMEEVADDLTLRQREQLAAAIYKYWDVFSSDPMDMGRTGLDKHTIDTGDPSACLSDDYQLLSRKSCRKKCRKCWIMELSNHVRAAGYSSSPGH